MNAIFAGRGAFGESAMKKARVIVIAIAITAALGAASKWATDGRPLSEHDNSTDDDIQGT